MAAIIATATIPRRSKRGVELPAQARRRGAVDAAIAGLLFQGGLRRCEAAVLTWADVSPATDGPGGRASGRHRGSDMGAACGRFEPIEADRPYLRTVSHARIDSEVFSGPGWCFSYYSPRGPAGALAPPLLLTGPVAQLGDRAAGGELVAGVAGRHLRSLPVACLLELDQTGAGGGERLR